MSFAMYIIFKNKMIVKDYKEMCQRMFISLWIPSAGALMRIPIQTLAPLDPTDTNKPTECKKL